MQKCSVLPARVAVAVVAAVSEVGKEHPFCLWARKTSKLLYCCLQKPQMWMSGLTSTTTECPAATSQGTKHETGTSDFNQKWFDVHII